MMTEILMAYAVVALLLAAHALMRLVAFRERTGEHLEGVDRAVLAGTALVASAMWVLLVPVFALGWIGSPRARALAAAARTRIRALHLRLAPRRLRHTAE